MGKFFSGTANDPFTSTWQNIFFFFSKSKLGFEFCCRKGFAQICVVVLRQHKEFLHAGSVIGF